VSNTDCTTTACDGATIELSDSRSVPPPDEAAHQNIVLIAELATLNTLLARYVLRHTDVEANRAAPIPTADEYKLADRLSAAADAIRARAQRCDQHERS
jgi:hypothetical protein